MPFVLWPWHFCVSSMVDPVPNFTNRILWFYRPLPVSSKEMELFTALSILGADAFKTYRSSFSIQISGGGKLMRY